MEDKVEDSELCNYSKDDWGVEKKGKLDEKKNGICIEGVKRRRLNGEVKKRGENWMEEEKDEWIVDFIDKRNNKEEDRIEERRKERDEEREIRMREIERKKKEIEENDESVYDM